MVNTIAGSYTLFEFFLGMIFYIFYQILHLFHFLNWLVVDSFGSSKCYKDDIKRNIERSLINTAMCKCYDKAEAYSGRIQGRGVFRALPSILMELFYENS